ncbi:MAG TPA: hypothetical protein PK636_10425, partial [bacterium]|nr:hypothetical protein [bacterium]
MKCVRIATAVLVLGIGAKTAGAQAPTPGAAPTPPLDLTRLGEIEPSKVLWAIRGTSRMYYFAREEYQAEGWMLTQPLAFFFNPDKFAFRAGWAYGNQWDDANVGNYSLATGYNTMARGWYSTALGAATSAEKDHCTAMGYSSKASGFCSTAVGKSTVAAGDYAIAMGYYSEASGEHALSLGAGTTASGDHSVALGDYSTASGASATAAGRASKASGDYAVALGYGVTAQDSGTVALGTWVTARAPNAMVIGAGRTSNEQMVNSIPNS